VRTVTEAAARAWADAWTRAWTTHDEEPLEAVYADDAVFSSHPFRQPHTGREGVLEYARWAFADEESAECRFGEPVASGDRATVEYWAVVVEKGREQTIAGVALLRFDADGRVREQRDYWAADEGRRPPPARWGT
jgi:ketosteroid isomerase-like protein